MSDHHQHDRLFREVFSERHHAISFFEGCLPTKTLSVLDINSLVCIDGSFIDKEFVESRADILFKVNTKNESISYIYTLLEHKSYSDRSTPLQILNYMVRIWRKHEKENKASILPHIIPILFYHGKRAWPWEPAIGSQFVPVPELERYVPHFVFDLHDLSSIPDNQIKGSILAVVIQQIFKYIYHPHKLEEGQKLELLLKLLHEETGMQYIEIVLKYLSSMVEIDTLVDIVDKIIPSGGEIMGTLAEKWEKAGVEKGILLGKAEGEATGILFGIEALLEARFGKDTVSLMDKMRQINDPEKLKTILKQIKLADSFDMVKQIVI